MSMEHGMATVDKTGAKTSAAIFIRVLELPVAVWGWCDVMLSYPPVKQLNGIELPSTNPNLRIRHGTEAT